VPGIKPKTSHLLGKCAVELQDRDVVQWKSTHLSYHLSDSTSSSFQQLLCLSKLWFYMSALPLVVKIVVYPWLQLSSGIKKHYWEVCQKNTHWRKSILFNNWFWERWISTRTRLNLDPYFLPCTRTTWNWSKTWNFEDYRQK
jgi:hypothetical protein